MAKKSLPRLTPSEFEIMDIIWDAGETTVAHIAEQINAQRQESLRSATIRVQVKRLIKKGWVRSKKINSIIHYSAAVPRAEVSSNMVDDVRERVFGGSYFDMVKALFSSKDISGEDIEKIRELIEKTDPGSK